MRFDDSLKTVLAADASSGFGAAATWRQLVDLMGRGRIAADEPAIARLRLLRQAVPAEVRAASARALAFATPGAGLVALFAEDELSIAAPVLRTASLSGEDWATIVPRLSPALRSVLRSRRDLPGGAVQALASFGSVDFVLADERPVSEAPATDLPATEPAADAAEAVQAAFEPAPAPLVLPAAPLSESPFQALGDVALGLPVVAEARRRAENLPPVQPPPAPVPASAGGYAISDLVERIDAFQRRRDESVEAQAPSAPPERFDFETDALGTIDWVDGVARAALIGVSFAYGGSQGLVQVDGIVGGAFRRRSSFDDARLAVQGSSDAAGSWRISAAPTFDPVTGRFTGYRGIARRPRADESAAPLRSEADSRQAASESLRQLVHELRTPANAIAGFAELIESQLLGPVASAYREQAGSIRAHAADLLSAIEDLDTAARLEGRALDLRPGAIALAPMLDRLLADLTPLVELRGVEPLVAIGAVRALAVDDRAAERLIGRLLATLIAASRRGERLGISALDADGLVAITFDRPAALASVADDALLTLDTNEAGIGGPGVPLLGVGFALRLARNLAAELGGHLLIEADRLTLRLPAVVDRDVGQATTI